MSNEKKYVGITGLAKFLEKLYGVFARISHTHVRSDISDFPEIPTKLSDLENDSGFITSDNNTTYTLTRVDNELNLSGSDGHESSVSLEDFVNPDQMDALLLVAELDIAVPIVDDVGNVYLDEFDNILVV